MRRTIKQWLGVLALGHIVLGSNPSSTIDQLCEPGEVAEPFNLSFFIFKMGTHNNTYLLELQ